jgi:mRNA interferase RelE/StbE
VLLLKPTKAVVRFIEDLPPKQFRQIWLTVLALLTEPYPQDSKQLQGYPYHRVDFGEYRIIYQVEEDTLKLILIGKRNDDEVYRQLRRL